MLRELPERYTNDNPDYGRWQFEAARAEWEADQDEQEQYQQALLIEYLESFRETQNDLNK